MGDEAVDWPASDEPGFLRERPIDDRRRERSLGRRGERAGEVIVAAADEDGQAALRVGGRGVGRLEFAEGIARALQRGEGAVGFRAVGFRKPTGPGVVAAGGDKEPPRPWQGIVHRACGRKVSSQDAQEAQNDRRKRCPDHVSLSMAVR